MNSIAHTEAPAEPLEAPARLARPARFRLHFRRETKAALGFGVLSGCLYYLLYLFAGDIRQLAELTNQGHKAYFLVPIAIAFLFSVVHGLFTDRFWEAMGLRAKRQGK